MSATATGERHFDATRAQYSFNANEVAQRAAAEGDGQGTLTSITHAVSRDQAHYARKKPSKVEYLQHARNRSGRSPMQLVMEHRRLKRGRGKLTLPEYVQWGVYDTDRYSSDEQSRFISNTLHWPITSRCCDMTWQAATEDKWLCSHILERSGVRVPETLAVIDKSDRLYPGTQKIQTAQQFRDFARSQNGAPFFGKENRGICSFGVFLVPDASDTSVSLKGHDPLPYESFMEDFVGDTPYLLQRLETNHGFFDRYTDSIATVRMCVLFSETGIKVPFAVLKLPSRDNLADSFWRPGNLACNLDTETGKVLGIRSVDHLGTTDHSAHPETNQPLLGENLPLWGQVRELAERCAPIFHPVRYQSMDIAITADGPVLIEINTGGGFDLPQLASGQGFLTDDVCAFFKSHGCQDF